MSDILNQEKINSLPHPLMVRDLQGFKWGLQSICIETGFALLDIHGMTERADVAEFKSLIDDEGNEHEIESFYCDSEREGVYFFLIQ